MTLNPPLNSNPLLDFTGLPRYSSIRTEHIDPAVDTLLAENRALVATLSDPATPVSWSAVVKPLEDANERLGRAWGAVGHLHGVLDSPELRAAYEANQPKIVQYYTELGQNLSLFGKYKALKASMEFDALEPAQRKIIENELRDFRLSGAELPETEKKRFADLQEELAGVCTRFSNNVLDATNAFTLLIQDAGELSGVPADVVEAAGEAAQKDGAQGWKLTLKAPCYIPVMQYADNRTLREKLYRAYVTRASEFDTAARDNAPLILRILKLRRESARLLDYANYAEVSLATKMAQGPAQVLEFLGDLARKALPYARRDYAELESFARDELRLENLHSWDLAWASEKLRAKRYAFSDQEIKQYFPEAKVLEGMFRVVERLYGISVVPDQAESWDAAVRFFRVVDAKGALIGQFYLDTYARETKRGGAWMDEAITRRRTETGVQAPVAYLICNFSPPVGARPALLTHDEVLTLFHEFGHGLHHLLTRVDYLGVSGIRGVEWDAVELPSQFMENFCWEWEVLKHMTAHVDDGAPLPRALFDKMLAAKNFQAGMQTVRQLEYALFDMRLHCGLDPDGAKSVQQLIEEVRNEVAVAFPPDYNRFANSFSHIFAGAGYAAGYYSYKWAEVLSADAYSMFEETREDRSDKADRKAPDQATVLDAATGARFLSEILAVGGSRPAIESFKAFRGREPSVDALLRHNGMIAS
ncbi:MAG: oligopeptidase A [Betaproteobacteria bacterium RIFCSPLOWO2_02_FULL_62_17]|nr:MAG: oligopeptidase A [Betaproteobacteria bacterium RIFCSPLOWO2_02_FULL_62_17]